MVFTGSKYTKQNRMKLAPVSWKVDEGDGGTMEQGL
jgi:hypothetical protein